ncbi:uncharacterized protein UMAG_00358 [Mycosarcoma maydis]|uniref:Uncharacterized protein n=1 Tax=Mycosarcoma maydis TaxID=5270 RepID=A0A0D1E998_MYCMD|nr:uncharacterized protein UMAG_00358 [Ustilago maydis 521]KIS71931.1 hypothetical protein UMAG_00358 [Ustilago maydis 521]|eukprot:XP_011386250.1 hypothetical protein UMAG_00358 [Ustilago maydis 521]
MAMRGGQGMDGGEEGCCKREDNKPKCEDRVDRVLLTLDAVLELSEQASERVSETDLLENKDQDQDHESESHMIHK